MPRAPGGGPCARRAKKRVPLCSRKDVSDSKGVLAIQNSSGNTGLFDGEREIRYKWPAERNICGRGSLGKVIILPYIGNDFILM